MYFLVHYDLIHRKGDLMHTLVSLIEGGEVIEGGVFIPANFQ